MRGQARPHLLLLLAGVSLSVAILSTAGNVNEALPATPAPQDQERYDAVLAPSTMNHVVNDDSHNHNHNHGHHDDAKPVDQLRAGRFSPIIWGQALFATALVGIAPVLVLLILPLGRGHQDKQQPLLRVFLSFAAGGLLGDALLHLLPHSLPEVDGSAHNHDHHEDREHSHSLSDLYVWLWTLVGILSFLMLEKFVRAQNGGSGGHSHGHAHSFSSVHDSGAVADKANTARKRALCKGGKDDLRVLDDEPVLSTLR